MRLPRSPRPGRGLAAAGSLALLSALYGCGGEPAAGGTCAGGKCDDIGEDDAGCTTIENASGRPITLADLDDPVADLVLRPAGSCPTTFSDVMKKVAANQAGCSGDYVADTATHVVSEEAQNARGVALPGGDPVHYRLVTQRTCPDRPAHELLLSLSAKPGDTAADLDQNRLELIGFDETDGVFNYYKASTGSGWEFVGDSRDMLAGGECGACHTGGGLVMKELHSPWIYWEEPTGVPVTSGVADLFESTATTMPGAPGPVSVLGAHDDLAGIKMEQLVRDGNLLWNETRAADALAQSTVRDLLRPLFCTAEINLDSSKNAIGGLGQPPSTTMSISSDFLLDPRLLGVDEIGTAEAPFGAGLTVRRDDYAAALGRAGQTVPRVDRPDTALPFVFPERSELEHNFVLTLIERGIIDDDFAVDVLAVDFTRPIFSDDRCGLLALAPEVKVAELPAPAGVADTPANRVRAAFVAALGQPAAGSAAAALARNLATSGDTAIHLQRAADFQAACAALPGPDFLDRALQIASQRRTLAAAAQPLHGYPGALIESPVMLPTDTLSVAAEARLHPVTCELIDELVTLE